MTCVSDLALAGLLRLHAFVVHFQTALVYSMSALLGHNGLHCCSHSSHAEWYELFCKCARSEHFLLTSWCAHCAFMRARDHALGWRCSKRTRMRRTARSGGRSARLPRLQSRRAHAPCANSCWSSLLYHPTMLLRMCEAGSGVNQLGTTGLA